MGSCVEHVVWSLRHAMNWSDAAARVKVDVAPGVHAERHLGSVLNSAVVTVRSNEYRP